MHNLIIAHLSQLFPGFWDYAHPVNWFMVLVVVGLFVCAIRLVAKLAPLLFLAAVVVLLWHPAAEKLSGFRRALELPGVEVGR